MNLVYLIPITLGAGWLGAVLHELTHALAARLLGFRNIRVNVRTLVTRYDAPRGFESRARIVGIAPMTAGILLAVPLVLVGRQLVTTSDFWIALPLLFAWIFYSFGGGLDDLRISRV